MFDTQPGQYSGLFKRYVVQQISALTSPTTAERQPDKVDLRSRALCEVADWSEQVHRGASSFLPRQSFLTSLGIRQLYGGLRQDDRAEWVECLLTNSRLLHSVTSAFSSALRNSRTLKRVSVCGAKPLPRAYLAVRSYLAAVQDKFSAETFVVFINFIQERATFDMDELWVLKPVLQLRLMQRLLQIGSELGRITDRESLQKLSSELVTILESLRGLDNANWDRIFAKLSAVEQILRGDAVYAQMEPASRDRYRRAIAEMALRSQKSEAEIAEQAMELGRQTHYEAADYAKHVGYYLIDEGRTLLRKLTGYRSSVLGWLGERIVAHAPSAYLLAIEFGAFVLTASLLLACGRSVSMAVILPLLLVPATGAAIDVVNQLIALLFPPRVLPKLDFTKGIPDDCLTVVAIPTLLLNESQTRQMAEALEVRFLGNRDKNLHFALLTDSVDSRSGPADADPLIRLCSQLIERLNRKYAPEGRGSFFHLHRHQVYCASEGIWMGWERKRGKLLDFNSFLRGEHDAFSVKLGDLSLLKNVRYVITLDSDTQLPRDAARKLIGTLAHPLNRAVLDPSGKRLQRGYAILQPKAGVDLQSARKSRLAAIFSADATFDVYTRAVSDVYQDLFGEGSFVGKGIYDIDAFHHLVDTWLPEGVLLSHDMIEGSFARAGLVSDIEIVEDYPSRYAVYCRRKHRWARGDWQTAPWIFPRVADRFGRDMPNALQIISRWKIVDNLRRALYEPVMLALLAAGWLFLPRGPVFWTGAVLVVVLLPSFLQLISGLSKIRRYSAAYLKSVALGFAIEQVRMALFFALLLHQSVIMVDAAARTVFRMVVTRRNLLEWETAAQAEMNAGPRSLVDRYLEGIPLAALAIGGVICLVKPHALPIALPFLVCWFLTGQIAAWLDRMPSPSESKVATRDREFLRDTALRTWRFFDEFSGPKNHWLISDRLQQLPALLVERVSPTNLGLLLNARLAAYDLGFIGLPQVVQLTKATLSAASKLERFRGHFYNWYDARTLQAEPPFFISSVDSGNLACSLLTTSQACRQMAGQPLFPAQLFLGIRDRLRLLRQMAGADRKTSLLEAVIALEDGTSGLEEDAERWIPELYSLERSAGQLQKRIEATGNDSPDLIYWSRDLHDQLRRLRQLAGTFAPWLVAGDKALVENLGIRPHIDVHQLTLEEAIKALEGLASSLGDSQNRADLSIGDRKKVEALLRKVTARAERARNLHATMEELAETCEGLAHEMDFGFLYNRQRKLLSIGYMKSANRVENACYDLLASEARLATFIAIAKGDIPQASWFYLGRGQTECENKRVLISWAGSLFEYLMPNLWMRVYANTLLHSSARAAINFHARMEVLKDHPWGISEAGFGDRDPNRLFQYEGFGAPGLALRRYTMQRWVISPYSTFLCLGIETQTALKNIFRMKERHWLGRYGFYESAEIKVAVGPGSGADRITRCWMAHHQGMILLAISNLLTRSTMQQRFHAVPMVTATERLLHEKMPAEIPVEETFAMPNLELAPSAPVELAPDTLVS
jgi:cyclic beta-1,2-glucan glucanotransferase